ncbi:hypothetical protein KKE92_05675 [Candidatus Micrarchaeota archaeon]|nr:hypothetical protein [Candidatus Micrarchaeota archaeon]MBU1681239.1 hypothetical protein [Candidatus Micrarchaeota archaeon]
MDLEIIKEWSQVLISIITFLVGVAVLLVSLVEGKLGVNGIYSIVLIIFGGITLHLEKFEKIEIPSFFKGQTREQTKGQPKKKFTEKTTVKEKNNAVNRGYTPEEAKSNRAKLLAFKKNLIKLRKMVDKAIAKQRKFIKINEEERKKFSKVNEKLTQEYGELQDILLKDEKIGRRVKYDEPILDRVLLRYKSLDKIINDAELSFLSSHDKGFDEAISIIDIMIGKMNKIIKDESKTLVKR